ncbi:putative set and mynd domain-containing protein, partial [Operophtera brumata]
MAGGDWLLQLEQADEGQKVKIMAALNDVLSRIQPLHRGKCARVSNERRLVAARSLQEGDLAKALALASQAVLRAPMTGTPLHRDKRARMSNERRLVAARSLQEGDLAKALALASQAVLRAPMTGTVAH